MCITEWQTQSNSEGEMQILIPILHHIMNLCYETDIQDSLMSILLWDGIF
jgi:hypothetical protein